MCGIVGYVGPRRVVPIVLEGLKHLEYRGYDSAGIVFLEDHGLHKYRSEGKLANLVEIMDDVDTRSCIGMGHTRWATHGAPSERNAHPHSDCTGELVVVHNGIIENYIQLRNDLQKKGHVFTSDTDTEVLAHLIEEYLADDLTQAVTRAVQDVEGAYALGVMWAREPDKIIAVRNQSPLVLGVKDGGGSFMASDVPALLPYTNKVIYLDDGDMAILTRESCDIFSLVDGSSQERAVQEILWNAGMAQKSGYRHFMLKEIFEQPQAILNTFRGRLDVETGRVNLSEIGLSDAELQSVSRIFLVACGTSWHAALVAKYWLEKWVRVPVEVDIASEFRYRTLLLDENVMVIPISQSGETADTLAGLRLAKNLGAKVISICNVLGSTITRESHGTIYTHAGPEIGVASTKAFTSQLTALFLFTMYMGQVRSSIDLEVSKELGQGLLALPAVIEEELPRLHKELEVLAEEFVDSRDFLYLGRGIHFPIALEGALKLKEISYIHAEGYAAGELKHGPIALIDKDMPVLALTPPDEVYGKVVSNVQEVKARHGRLILVGDKNNRDLVEIADDCIFLPSVHPEMQPILYTIPLQILSYHIAHLRGCDVDQPRNLAKSVTVE